MAAARQPQLYSPDEYLALEEQTDLRHEFLDGSVVAMSGSSVAHNLIVGNVFAELKLALKQKPCRVFSADLKVTLERRRYYFYPDVFVICGEIEFDGKREDAVRNPAVIVEVLSPSTQAFDKTEKFELYRALPSLQEYVLIDQKRSHIEHYRKQGRFWVLETLTALNETLVLPSLGVALTLAAIYEHVEFKRG